jgi:hypothetical protein
VPATAVFCDADSTAAVNNFSALRAFYGSNNLQLSKKLLIIMTIAKLIQILHLQ